MKHIFIINPISGKNNGKQTIPLIEEICLKHSLDFQIIETKSRKHATSIASNYTTKDNVTIYSVGGDGTLHEIINGLNKDVPLGIIPAGSGNDFYRMISKDNTPLKQLIEATIFGKIIMVDYINTNVNKYINCLSMGFDANINDLANKFLRKTILPKNISYLTSAIMNIANPKPLDLIIETDEATYQKKCLLVAIMNGAYYGGGFNPTPSARIDDEYLDVCIIEYVKRTKIMTLMAKFFKGQHTHIKECTIIKTKNITIKSSNSLLMQTDGESFYLNEITAKIADNKLNLKIPFYYEIN